MGHAQSVFSDVVSQGTASATKGFAWWRSEVRRSRVVQYGTIVVVILLIVAVTWAVKHKQRRLSPLQKIERALDF